MEREREREMGRKKERERVIGRKKEREERDKGEACGLLMLW